MQKVSLWDGFYQSFADPKAYRSFLNTTTGRVMLHTVLVALVITLFVGLPIASAMHNGMSRFATVVQHDFPEFRLENGRLTVFSDMPIVAGQDGFPIIVDTTGNTTKAVLDSAPQGFLITATTVYQKKSPIEITEFDLSQIGTVITKADLLRITPYFKWLEPIVLMGTFGFYLLGNLLVALLCAGAYSVSGKGEKQGLDFGACYKLMLLSMTLPRVLIGVFSLVSVSIPFYYVITLVATVFFAHRGIQAMEPTVVPPVAS